MHARGMQRQVMRGLGNFLFFCGPHGEARLNMQKQREDHNLVIEHP